MRKYFLAVLCWLLLYTVNAQRKIVLQGSVLSASTRSPLEGATLRGQGYYAVTTPDGSFAINISSFPDTLTISFTGYQTQQRIVLNNAAFVITLEESIGHLADVSVSTGYQTLPKERATGSFVQLDNSLLSQQVATKITDKLEAITPSLSVDRRTNAPGIMIRGLSTIEGPRGPLVVLDNFPYNGDIANINPQDIASITILKDAAAASIWGTKAGNGVIVITTKKGHLHTPVSLSFISSLTAGAKPDLGYVRQMGSSDFIDVEEMLFSKGFYNSQLVNPSQLPLSPVIEMLAKQDTNGIAALRNHDIRNDFSRYVYRPLINQQYALNANGGSDKMTWYLSGGYDHNIDNLAAGYTRLSLRSDNAWYVGKSLQFSAGFSYAGTTSTSGKPGYYNMVTANGNLPPYASLQGAMLKDYRQPYIDTAGQGRLVDWNYYPLEDYKHSRSTTKGTDIIGNAALLYQLAKGFSVSLRFQYEQQQTDTRTLYDPQSYFARNLVNRFTQINNGQTVYKVPLGSILDLTTATLISQQERLQLDYHRRIGRGELTALGGLENREITVDGSSYRTYGYNNDLLTFGTVDYTTPYPVYINKTSQFIPNNNGFIASDNRFLSVFANAAYTWLEKYTLSASGRRDASNIFGAATNDKWNLLWSTGGSWELSREKFYHAAFLPYLRARLTFGYSGNADPTKTAVSTISYVSNSPYTLSPVARFENYGNPELRWETTGMLNAGIDFKGLHNRLSGSLEYYHKKGSGLFGPYPLDYTDGQGFTIHKNVAAMAGNGIDIELHSVNLNGAFAWNTTLNFSYYSDKITQYYEANTQGSFYVSATLPQITGIVGRPVYSIMAYRWEGLDPSNGNPRGLLNGIVSEDYSGLTGTSTQDTSLVFKGSALPVYFGSLLNTFSWKHFSLTVALTYKLGYFFRKASISYSALFSGRNGNADLEKRWQQPGDEQHTDIPSMVYPSNTQRDNFYNGSEATIDKGDNIRLQYLTLGYNPNRRWSFYINANNLGILWRANKDHIDPDYPANGLPNAVSVAAGITVNL